MPWEQVCKCLFWHICRAFHAASFKNKFKICIIYLRQDMCEIHPASYWSISKILSSHSHVYIFIIIREDVIQLCSIWKAVTSTRSWYRNTMITHCSMCPYKRILSRLKTYETPCMMMSLNTLLELSLELVHKR